MKKNIADLVTITVCGIMAGCSDGLATQPVEEGSSISLSSAQKDSAASEVTDAKGHKFILVGPAKTLVLPEKARETDYAPILDHPEEMTDDELAEALRPVLYRQGYHYIAREPATEMVAQWRAKKWDNSHGESFEGDAPPAEQPEETEPFDYSKTSKSSNIIIGSDNRLRVISTQYPWRTQVAWNVGTVSATIPPDPANRWVWNDPWCSATLVGASTAVTVAHCHYDANSSSWMPLMTWASNPQTDKDAYVYEPYGHTYGCYSLYLPSAYTTTGSWEWDWAAVEFSDTSCGVIQPGNTVGWLGYWTSTQASVGGKLTNLYGFPGDPPAAYTATYPFAPNLYGHNMTIPAFSTTSPWQMRYPVDTTGGQSGSGVYQAWGGTNYVVGVHQGFPGGTTNQARLMDSQYVAFISTYTAL